MSTSQAAPSMGSAIGAAISLTIFTSFLGEGVTIVGEVLHTHGIQENAPIRQAVLVTFMFNLIQTLIAIISITLTIPKGKKYYD
jgi:MFS transporter, DHA2 family, multidrug resistance protein